MSLKEYARKRNFRKTAEPKGGRIAPARGGVHRFVVQKHAASRLHYDFRLELGGTLKSWAVPKGIPFQKGEKRLAVRVEDHPVSYIGFEGTIPKGQYGGGTVMVWDRGTFEPQSEAPAKDLAAGKLHFTLAGKKLRGEWYLVRLREGDEWLLIRGGEDMKPVSQKADDTSAASGKSMAAIAGAKRGRVWKSNRKEESSAGLQPAPTVKVSPATRRRTKTAGAVPDLTARSPEGRTSASRARAEAPRYRRTGKRGEGAAAPKKAGRAGRGEGAAAPSAKMSEFVDPMKALLMEKPPKGDWIYEIKFDGFRALAFCGRGGARLVSRNNKDFSEKFPEVAEAVASLALRDTVLDGEIVALDEKGRSSFQLLQAYDLGQERPSIYFYVFDLLRLEGEDLMGKPLTERKAELEKLLKGAPDAIRYSASLSNDPEKLLEQARRLGLEGLIGKKPDSRYEAGRRSGAWIKLKLHQEQEFVIGGYTPPGGSRTHFGALLVGYYEPLGRGLENSSEKTMETRGRRGRETPPYNGGGRVLRFAGKVGTGFNAKLLRSLHEKFQKIATDECPFVDLPEKRSGRYGQGVTAAEMKRCHWVKPVLVCQIRFAEWTRDDRLRQPVFLGLREDKAAREVVREKGA